MFRWLPCIGQRIKGSNSRGENSIYGLQSVSIIAAFPIGIIIILMIWSFYNDVNVYLNGR